MIVNIQGVVFKSIKPEGKKMWKTAITQGENDLNTTVISTVRGYKPGEKINISARVSVSTFKDKGYLVVVEEQKDEPDKKAA